VALHGVAATQIDTFSSPMQAFEAAIDKATEADRVIVFGSFVTVGAVLASVSTEASQAQA
jgi:dihydrofolate synthase/folylpolyglutamate synthase